MLCVTCVVLLVVLLRAGCCSLVAGCCLLLTTAGGWCKAARTAVSAVCLSVYLSVVCLSVGLIGRPSVCLSVGRSVCLLVANAMQTTSYIISIKTYIRTSALIEHSLASCILAESVPSHTINHTGGGLSRWLRFPPWLFFFAVFANDYTVRFYFCVHESGVS